MSAVVIFALIRERRGEASGNIIIEEAGIVINGDARTRKLLWTEIDAVLLRFGILTIECADNRLIQRNIADSTINAASVTQYCIEKIEASKAARVANDW
jgi:hypothetical protein